MSELIGRRDMMRSVGLGALAFSMGSKGAAAAEGSEAKTAVPKEYELPDLPYAFDALAPVLAEDVLRVHHDRHHAGYVNGLNSTLKKLEQARAAGDFGNVKALSRDLAFHGSGHVLHSLYWQSMTPGGSSEPEARLLGVIERDFGSYAGFKGQFLAATKAVEGSGWGLLAYEPVGQGLVVLQVEKHQNLTIWGVVPLMVCDVWEHAYYVQYQNRRSEYVDGFFKLIDWPGVEARCVAAMA